MKMKILAAVGAGAIVLAASGVAVATTISATHTTAKACVASNGVLKLAQSSGKCPRGSSPFTMLAKGGPGTALGYAHIKSGDVFDGSRSYNVKASNVVTEGNGWVCFRGLKFTPHIAQVTLDYNGIFNGQIPQATVIMPANPGECGLTSAQAEVFTGLVASSSRTNGAKLGFYVVFY